MDLINKKDASFIQANLCPSENKKGTNQFLIWSASGGDEGLRQGENPLNRISICLGTILVVLVFTSAVPAAPVVKEDFGSSASTFDFSSTASSDFTISGGTLVSGTYNSWTKISVEFFSPIGSVGADVTRSKNQSIEMSLFDSSSILLENYSWSGSAPFFIGLDYGENYISKIEIYGGGDDIWIDNLIYQTEIDPESVPLPATFYLLGSGLISLVGLRKRYLKSKN